MCVLREGEAPLPEGLDAKVTEVYKAVGKLLSRCAALPVAYPHAHTQPSMTCNLFRCNGTDAQ